jgi:hypothetical protein
MTLLLWSSVFGRDVGTKKNLLYFDRERLVYFGPCLSVELEVSTEDDLFDFDKL